MLPTLLCTRLFRTLPYFTKCALTWDKVSKNHFNGKLNLILPSLTFRKLCTGKSIVVDGYFAAENKNKDTYLTALEVFKGRDIHRRGHVEFINAALKYMEEYGVHKDLEAYKALLDVLPKGKFIAENIFQVEFMHYPKQQQCAIDLLDQMEMNGVMPDIETETILINIFGRKAFPLKKFWRMLYWMPKFKNLSPWPLPNPVPNDSFELAMLAIKRISGVDTQTNIKIYQTENLQDSLDKTWIICAQSPKQHELLAEHPNNKPVYIEGPFRIWLRDAQVNYFVLRADPIVKPKLDVDEDNVSKLESFFVAKPKKKIVVVSSVHEQEDSTILSVFATGTSSRDSLLSLVRLMEEDGNPVLNKIPVLFTMKSPLGEVVPVNDSTNKS